MLIKPIRKDLLIFDHPGPAVVFARAHNQLRRCTCPLALFDELLRLVNRHQLVGIAMNDEHRRLVRVDEINRRNFTAAHELGHFLLHDFDEVHVDRDFKVWLRNDASSQGTNVEEKEANLFAAELLMPAHFLARDVDNIGTIDLINEEVLQELASRYGVSTQAMTFRLAYLGCIRL